MDSFIFNCGDRVKDGLTKLQGIVVSRSQSLYGCNRYWIQPEDHKDGKPLDGGWFDEDAIELIDSGAFKPRVRLGVVKDDAPPYEPQQPMRRTGGFDLPSPTRTQSK